MVRRQKIADEVKAQIIAESVLGGSNRAIGKKYGVSEATVRLWRKVASAQPIVTQEKRVDIGELVFEYIQAGFLALIAQAKEAATPSLIREQGHSLYLLHGTLADKLVSILRGIESGQTIETGPPRLLPPHDPRLPDSASYPDDDR